MSSRPLNLKAWFRGNCFLYSVLPFCDGPSRWMLGAWKPRRHSRVDEASVGFMKGPDAPSQALVGQQANSSWQETPQRIILWFVAWNRFLHDSLSSTFANQPTLNLPRIQITQIKEIMLSYRKMVASIYNSPNWDNWMGIGTPRLLRAFRDGWLWPEFGLDDRILEKSTLLMPQANSGEPLDAQVLTCIIRAYCLIG